MDNSSYNSDQNQNFKDQVVHYLNKWPWFIISVLLMLLCGFLFLRYSTPKFEATAKILIKDTQGGGGFSELAALGDIDVLGNSFNTVENEIEVLKSHKLMNEVVELLDLNITYSKIGNIKSSQIYNNSPIKLTLLTDSIGHTLKKSIKFKISNIDNQQFKLFSTDGEMLGVKDYGKLFNYSDIKMLILPNELDKTLQGKNKSLNSDFNWDELYISVSPISQSTKSILTRLSITKSDKRGSVLELKLEDTIKRRAQDILNTLINVFNQDAIKDKNEVAQNTSQFIEERLNSVRKDLDSLERGIQKFKTVENLTDIVTEAGINLESKLDINREVIVAETQLEIAKSLKSQLNKDRHELIPENVGLDNLNIQESSTSYNLLVQRYKEYSRNATNDNPILITLLSQIRTLKESILLSLDNIITSLNLKKNSLEKELNSVSGKISKIPENERVNRDIERDRLVIEAIYLLLNEKKETTAISLAVTAPKAKIVDFALVKNEPVSPKPKLVYLGCLFLGLIIPFVFIYSKSILYNKIESRKDIQQLLPALSILGEVPKLDSDSLDYIEPNDRSVLAESFRIIRTNLQYKLNAVNHNDTKIILVTSTVKGEGKTLVSYNTANTFAYSGKKVLLIGGDIRNPQLHRYSSSSASKRTKGVTEYLVNNDLTLDDLVIHSSKNDNLDILLSGAIPPNPAELWMQDRTKQLFEEAKANYDLVIIDSAPTILVTDTLLINKYADVTTYVTRANYTDKSLLEFVSDTIDAGKLTNVAVVVNNVKLANFGYGNKYGYVYGEDKKTLWSTLKSKFGR
ncbi:tyrosine protein kinase [Nonlabens dokdonensis]|uniref:non-specific protein-tyrosine kinase n=1 Tax=Nonlabens dokdonensis TaxID=328515 RepID=A0A1Z8API8_9FLAO|nr:polysaccharide biosynthesis tyrosine autokinase [Nonlabens dokdonensis]OUS12203.1 tyrosine protein kinase [Nonlabens dokdonensis]